MVKFPFRFQLGYFSNKLFIITGNTTIFFRNRSKPRSENLLLPTWTTRSCQTILFLTQLFLLCEALFIAVSPRLYCYLSETHPGIFLFFFFGGGVPRELKALPDSLFLLCEVLFIAVSPRPYCYLSKIRQVIFLFFCFFCFVLFFFVFCFFVCFASSCLFAFDMRTIRWWGSNPGALRNVDYPLLLLLPSPLWHRMVVPVKVPSMGQIELFNHYYIMEVPVV